MATVVNQLIEQHGGLQGLIDHLDKSGLGTTVKSWVGTGANEPINADEVHRTFGPSVLGNLAAKVGISPEDLSAKLATLLPHAIDALTPNGAVVGKPVAGRLNP
ncbi:MAG: hypothetical protein QOD56_1075 [Gammaproteobacteria bacterium]|jgi:uncharacterized protein YidB (DUF937 family)|nr:hypothetical protein [Gammaproteobacteria bacterium]